MRHQYPRSILPRQPTLRSDAFVEQMQTDVRVDGTQRIIEQVNVGLAIHSSG